jgi:uncharacterized repeat protein (TIGR03803 family)
MRGKRLFIGLRDILAIFALAVFVTGSAASQEKVLHSFGNGTDGLYPYAGLIFDAAGNLYSTTEYGGIHGQGAVFELSPREGGGWTETVLHSFGQGTDGSYPDRGLVFDAAGNLYGTTIGGGIHYNGSVVELSPRQRGGWTEQVLHSFNANGTDGYYLYGGLIIDTAGNVYGTTNDGGTLGYGTVFELTPGWGGDWSERVLHSFGRNDSDGSLPYDGLIIDTAGNLYGTTNDGGIYSGGTVFEITP